MDLAENNEVEFDKLNNILINALKEITPVQKVLCTKCHDLVPVVKHGITGESYQFQCKIGKHYNSAVRVLNTLPDDFINAKTEILEIKYRAEILKWLEKDHLWSELLQVKMCKKCGPTLLSRTIVILKCKLKDKSH